MQAEEELQFPAHLKSRQLASLLPSQIQKKWIKTKKKQKAKTEI